MPFLLSLTWLLSIICNKNHITLSTPHLAPPDEDGGSEIGESAHRPRSVERLSRTQDPSIPQRPRYDPNHSPPPYSEIAHPIHRSFPTTLEANPHPPPPRLDANLFHPTIPNAPIPDLSPFPTPSLLSDDFYARIRDNPRLLPIFGVAIVFHGHPSVLQISRVLGVRPAEVTAALKPLSLYLDSLVSPVDHFSNVVLRNDVKDALLRRSAPLWVDAAKSHALVARWCLIGRRTLDARDITYASEFWAYHVCNSDPSVDLYDALRMSRIPLDPLSRSQLAEVIYWLEENGGPQVSDLLEAYRAQYNKPPERVNIMGGMFNMFFW
ncbi:hypothetical protein C8R46DRAFT_1226928 [Mycena filopes]|nr:hypothetical protein C8R46DRAFT_1226928 [Mycena filopes]